MLGDFYLVLLGSYLFWGGESYLLWLIPSGFLLPDLQGWTSTTQDVTQQERTSYTWSSFGTKSSSSFSSSISLESCFSALEPTSSSPETTHAKVRDRKRLFFLVYSVHILLLLSLLLLRGGGKSIVLAGDQSLTAFLISLVTPGLTSRAQWPAPNITDCTMLFRGQKIHPENTFSDSQFYFQTESMKEHQRKGVCVLYTTIKQMQLVEGLLVLM